MSEQQLQTENYSIGAVGQLWDMLLETEGSASSSFSVGRRAGIPIIFESRKKQNDHFIL
jgi:hypothetical protein